MRIALLSVVLVSGCGGPQAFQTSRVPQHQTYPSWHFVPLEAELELLPTRGATGCVGEEDRSNDSSTPHAIGPGFLFEQTKQKIMATDDGVIVTSAVTSYVNNQICVTMTGRPYKIVRVRAAHGASADTTAATQAQKKPKASLMPLPDLGGE